MSNNTILFLELAPKLLIEWFLGDKLLKICKSENQQTSTTTVCTLLFVHGKSTKKLGGIWGQLAKEVDLGRVENEMYHKMPILAPK